MKLVLTQNPIAKARYRHMRKGNKIITFDPQDKDKKNTKLQLIRQMREKGYSLASEGPLSMNLINYTKTPLSWPERRRMDSEGQSCVSRPDLDNYVKFYCDVLNEVAYCDDRQITRLWSEKLYSSNPRVEIIIEPIAEQINKDHVVTVVGMLSDDQLTCLSKKANALGLQNRKIVRLFSEEDDKGKHLYFEVERYNLGSLGFIN